MVDIAANWRQVNERVASAAIRAGRSPDAITVVAVSKTMGVEAIREAVLAGVTQLGENRVQEAEAKLPALAALGCRPRWHLIGHLQTNKVKTALSLFDIIESVDSLRLAEAIAQRAAQPVPVLLQVNMAGESTKGGFTLDAGGDGDPFWPSLERIRALPGVKLVGLMTIPPLVADPEETRPLFRRLRELIDRLGLPELSMGMTGDYEVAIEEGATIVRIGRAIFGERRPTPALPAAKGE